MAETIGRAALKLNPALQGLRVLVGTWDTKGSHPYLPGVTLRGRASYQWAEGGAFLLMRTEVDHPEIPDAVALIGSDDDRGEILMSYFDERDISRFYRITVEGDVIRWARNSPHLSQRMTLAVRDGGDTVAVTGEMSRDGKEWEPDLQLTYTRAAG